MAAPTAVPEQVTPAPIEQSPVTGDLPRWARLASVGLALAYIAVHLVAAVRENVNWDEIALLARSVESIASGVLIGGGRPGLATLLLIPFAEGGANSISAVIDARLFWSLFTFAYLAGIYALVAHFDGGKRWSRAGLAAVGLIALVPLFQRWSLQVRTDQPALAFATWGGVALLASRKRPWLGAISGLLFAVGYLFTQKAAYVVALAGLLAAGALWIERDFRLRREALRVGGIAVAGLAVYFGYLRLVSFFFDFHLASPTTVIEAMGSYRQLGLLVYRSLPALMVPHLILGILLAAATVRAFLQRNDDFRRCILAWLVLAAGFAAGFVHGSRFAYFWMTLGLFPAVGLGIGIGPILRSVRSRTGDLVLAFVGVLLLARAIPQADEITTDSVWRQERAVAFVDRNFAPGVRGFHPEKALFHRRDPNPFPTYFYRQIRAIFTGANGRANAETFIGEFRKRNVAFMVDSHRLRMFPPLVQEFWAQHYIHYADSVYVAGRALQGEAGTKLSFEVIAPGDYTLILPDDHPPARIAIGGNTVEPGKTVSLPAGVIEIELLEPVGMGLFTLKLEEPPNPASYGPFYDPVALAELDGTRHWSWVPGL